MSTIKMIFRSLEHRNYRLYFGGQAISLTGTWMQNIAMSWLVYRLTNSAFLLGVVGFAGQIPSLVLTPYTGVFADRYNKHRIIAITQTLSMIQALGLAALTLTNTINIFLIITLSLILGIINAFDAPARQAFVVELVERREDLPNAIALNSFLFNGARLVGPSVAGLLIALIGEGMCFLVNGLSYIGVIWALLAMRIQRPEVQSRDANFWQGFTEGLRYAYAHVSIRSALLLLAIVSLIGMGYTTLMPVIARDVLRGGSHTLGFLVGASGVGAVIGAVFLASRKSTAGLEKLIPVAPSLMGAGLVAVSFTRHIVPAMALMVIVGFGFMVQMASTNTFIQTMVEDDKRGRVMSLYTLAFMGVTPFGNLLAGSLAHKIGAPHTLMYAGIICVSASLLFSRQVMRRGARRQASG